MSSSPSSSAPNPTIRSRTLLFISYRDSRAGASRSRRARIITNYDDAQDDGDDEHDDAGDGERDDRVLQRGGLFGYVVAGLDDEAKLPQTAKNNFVKTSANL